MNLISFMLRLFSLLLIFQLTTCGIVPHPGDLHHIVNNEEITIPDRVNQYNNLNTIRVMTLNLAHGRRTSFHQLFLGTDKIKKNLDTVAKVINREKADVVALQEADGQSFWSGSFNHVEYLLKRANFISSVQGYHVKGMGLQYGTAILSGLKLTNNNSHNLTRSTLTLPKGFVVSSINWPADPAFSVDIVSVHLDFMSVKTRKQQAKTLVNVLKSRNRPMIMMGDFNTYWDHDDGVMKYITAELELTVYQPGRKDIVTFPDSMARLDWILITRPLEFVRQEVIIDELSDHRAVIADITLALTGGIM